MMKSRAISLGIATAVLVTAGWRATPRDPAESSLHATVELLERRVDLLEANLASRDRERSGLPNQVQAPFEVVDRFGNVIFLVTAEALGSVSKPGRVTISRGSADNFVVTLRRLAGQVAVELGEASAPSPGMGIVAVRDPSGKKRVELDGSEGVRTYSPTGKEVIGLGFDARTPEAGVVHLRGLMQVFDAGGRTTVEAGTLPDGTGVVRVGPNFKCSGYAGMRMPDCIKGLP